MAESELLIAKFSNGPRDDASVAQAWATRLATQGVTEGVLDARVSASLAHRQQNDGNDDYLLEIETTAVNGLPNIVSQSLVHDHQDGGGDAAPDVRSYRKLAEWVNTGYSRDRSHVVVAVWMTSNNPVELERWYREEHIALLFDVPGWMRSRRFERIAGGGPQFLALHEVMSEETVDHPAAAPARNTPWRDRVIADLTESEYRVYQVLHQIERAEPSQAGSTAPDLA